VLDTLLLVVQLAVWSSRFNLLAFLAKQQSRCLLCAHAKANARARCLHTFGASVPRST
jgi:hypothetical protein